jgi:3-phenylpropionate/cinnamic acid dioxygenase small subunit
MSDPLLQRHAFEIQQLLQRIAAAADTATDIQDYLDLLTDDAVFDFAPVAAIGLAANRYTGHREIREGVIDRRRAGVQGPGTNTLHIVSDVVVDQVSDDTAAVYAAWHYLGIRDSVPALLAMGTYRNTVRRVGGRWLLSRREVVVFG